jgi:hypothetical protein
MCEVAGLKNEIADRLLTDRRMEQAWKDLRDLPEPVDLQARLQAIRPGFSPDAYREGSFDLTPFDRQSAALFYQVTHEVHQPERNYWTKGEADKLAQPFLDAAKLCEESARTDITIQRRDDLLKALRLVGGYLQDQGNMRQMSENPRVIGRRLPDVTDEKRGHARMIATIIRGLFSPPAKDFPHSAVGRFMAVSLGIEDDVLLLKNSVRSWCKDLPLGEDVSR